MPMRTSWTRHGHGNLLAPCNSLGHRPGAVAWGARSVQPKLNQMLPRHVAHVANKHARKTLPGLLSAGRSVGQKPRNHSNEFWKLASMSTSSVTSGRRSQIRPDFAHILQNVARTAPNLTKIGQHRSGVVWRDRPDLCRIRLNLATGALEFVK